MQNWNITGNCKTFSNGDTSQRIADLDNGHVQIPMETESNLVDQQQEAFLLCFRFETMKKEL